MQKMTSLPSLLFFPVLSGKMTFSIHKDESFQKILTVVTEKKKSTTATTKTTTSPPVTFWKKCWAVGDKSHSSRLAFHTCFHM